MFDITLLVKISFILRVTKLCFFECIGGVISTVHTHSAGFNFHYLSDYLVKKITVMGYNKYSSRIVEQISFQPGNTLHIKVVGRLIQQKDIRAGEKQFTESNTCFLTSGESFNLAFEIIFGKAKTF